MCYIQHQRILCSISIHSGEAFIPFSPNAFERFWFTHKDNRYNVLFLHHCPRVWKAGSEFYCYSGKKEARIFCSLNPFQLLSFPFFLSFFLQFKARQCWGCFHRDNFYCSLSAGGALKAPYPCASFMSCMEETALYSSPFHTLHSTLHPKCTLGRFKHFTFPSLWFPCGIRQIHTQAVWLTYI